MSRKRVIEFSPQNSLLSPVKTAHAQTGEVGAMGQITAKKGVSAKEIENFIIQESKKYGVNEKIALFVAYKESQYHLDRRGDGGHSRGLYQISDIWHPEISDECAFDLKCSTRFFMKQVLAGKITEWSAWRLRDKLYADAIN